jgi:hypothetical protein
VPDPVAERVGIGVPQVLLVAVNEEAGPGGQVGGDVRGDDPAAVTCQDFEGRFRRPMALAARTPAVSTTACSRWTTSMYWGWWLPGTSLIPLSGMFVQVTEYRQPVFFS